MNYAAAQTSGRAPFSRDRVDQSPITLEATTRNQQWEVGKTKDSDSVYLWRGWRTVGLRCHATAEPRSYTHVLLLPLIVWWQCFCLLIDPHWFWPHRSIVLPRTTQRYWSLTIHHPVVREQHQQWLSHHGLSTCINPFVFPSQDWGWVFGRPSTEWTLCWS